MQDRQDAKDRTVSVSECVWLEWPSGSGGAGLNLESEVLRMRRWLQDVTSTLVLQGDDASILYPTSTYQAMVQWCICWCLYTLRNTWYVCLAWYSAAHSLFYESYFEYQASNDNTNHIFAVHLMISHRLVSQHLPANQICQILWLARFYGHPCCKCARKWGSTSNRFTSARSRTCHQPTWTSLLSVWSGSVGRICFVPLAASIHVHIII